MLDADLDELLSDNSTQARVEETHRKKGLGRGLGALLGDDLDYYAFPR